MGNDAVKVEAPAPRRRAHLICLSGENVGQVFDLREVTVLGRHNGVDIPVSDGKVSRRHVEIRIVDGEAQLVDLGSRNGTYINNQIVKQSPLREGDQLRLGGGTVLKFTWGEELAGTAPLRGEPPAATMAELRSAQQRLVQSEKLIAVCQLGSGVAHEIINPLSAVMHNLSFIDGELQRLAPALGEPGAELVTALKDARDGALRIRKIVSDLQEFSWQAHDVREPVDLQLVVEDAIRITQEVITRSARLERDFRPAPQVEANPKRLGQVFVYLLTNAAEAVPAGSPDRNYVSVGIATDVLGRAVVEVRDTGIGISQDILHRIFDPFFTTKSFGKGTGLSLAMAQGIVTALGGEISVESQPGEGSVFRVVLPASRERLDSQPVTVPAAVRLLAIGEDSKDAGETGAALGHTVVRARTTEEALERLRGEKFDLVFLPLFAEGVDAPAFLAHLANLPPEQQRRVIFLVPDPLAPEQEQYLERRAHARLTLPVERARLARLIPQWLRLWED